MGWDGGDLIRNSELVQPFTSRELQLIAQREMAADPESEELPGDAFVFSAVERRAFLYVRTSGSDDTAVYRYNDEDDSCPVRIADHF